MATGKATPVRRHATWIAAALVLQVPALWLMAVALGWEGPLGLGALLAAGLGGAALAARLGPGPSIALSCVVGFVALLLAFAAATGALSTG